jgi:hypothetical protein
MEAPAGAAQQSFFTNEVRLTHPDEEAEWPAEPNLGERRMVAIPSAALGRAGL